MIYIRVRCQRCRGVLAEFDSYPADFQGRGAVQVCGRCGRPGPDEIVGVMGRRGVDSMPVLHTFEWSTMREYVRRAEATGKTTTVVT